MTRKATVSRTTKETSINVTLDLDGTGSFNIATGIGFLDHMLEQLSFHSLIDMDISCKGDLHIDGHHTTEDVALALGQALLDALGDKKGIMRYAHAYIPMDEALLRCAIDVSGRPDFVFQGEFRPTPLGGLDTQMIAHFFKSLAHAARLTLHLDVLRGENDHHKCEGLFKALARALGDAVTIDPRRAQVASTKGTL